MADPDPTERVGVHRLRDRIDALDREIVALLNERAELAVEIGRVKATVGDEIHDPERERQVLERVAALNDGPLPASELQAIYERLFAATRALQERERRSTG